MLLPLITAKILIPYLDDFIIPAKTEQEALEKLQKVLQVAKDYSFERNWKNCDFLSKKIEYLGYEVENNTIKPSEDKIKCVMKFPEPKDVKGVQSFLGLSGYFRKFIPNYSTIARPLSNLLKKNVIFQFGLEQKAAFQTLKDMLSSRPVLNLFDPEAITELHTDASKYGLGASSCKKIKLMGNYIQYTIIARKLTKLNKTILVMS